MQQNETKIREKIRDDVFGPLVRLFEAYKGSDREDLKKTLTDAEILFLSEGYKKSVIHELTILRDAIDPVEYKLLHLEIVAAFTNIPLKLKLARTGSKTKQNQTQQTF